MKIVGAAIQNTDCFNIMRDIPAQSVDLIICDLPYGQTDAQWDREIDPGALWMEFRRILTERGTLLSFGAGAFAIRFAAPAVNLYKYDLVWCKPQPTQHIHVRNRPRPQHERIDVFSKGVCFHRSKRRMTFHHDGYEVSASVSARNSTDYIQRFYAPAGREYMSVRNTSTSLLQYPKDGKVHSTQKPLDLLTWLVCRYSNPGDVVFDPTMGSGSTGVAATQSGRAFVGSETNPDFYAIADERIFGQVEVAKAA